MLLDQKLLIIQIWPSIENQWLQINLMPCPFTGPKMFCAGPNFLSQQKNLTAFSASSKTFVLAQKTILLNANHLFVWHKMFVTAIICKKNFVLAQKIWNSTNHFGTCKRTRHQFVKDIYVDAKNGHFWNSIF